jgi:hypothetical protein
VTTPPAPVGTPYTPYAPRLGGMAALLSSVVSVIRPQLVAGSGGGASVTWSELTDIIDPQLNVPGQMRCRIDLQFIRRGTDQPPAVAAGRAPDRVGVMYFIPATDENGVPLVLAGDRAVTVSGPVFGVFDIRQIPDVALDFVGGHHVETQVVEVAQNLKPGSVTPFPRPGTT